MNKFYKFNFLLFITIIIIGLIGFFALYSAAHGSLDPWAKKHIIRFFLSSLLLIFISLINLKFIYKYAYLFFIICLSLLLIVQIFGTLGYGAKRWVYLLGISIQPSELIKIGIILALGKYYHDLRYDRIGKISNLFLPLLIIFLPFTLIILQPDLGTSLMIVVLGVAIMFSAGVKLWKFILGSLSLIFIAPFVWNFLKPYQQKRLFSFFNPELDPLGSGYQIIQSKIALGSGGIFGKGFLQGTQSYLDYLPEKQTDFIFTLIGEEFGFLGLIFILILFLIIIFICFYISVISNNIFGRIVSIGISINLFLYVLLNTFMVTGLIPVVGVPIPLISHGGTVMLSIMTCFGILMNIGINSNQKKL
ncbi:MAG: Rod shape-determining protein RodA [Alphaproteobacteria bacterium MarineAlpha5_Bin9]|nr:MAG: Rod shape-determining protein RodA [Alphaproteobacteria bacterium MarineAlpha5_Bin9]|tara:strand:+ start:16362 stop:17447 length:1086 start_codon:yes stop_codon:yes gene_type:complete